MDIKHKRLYYNGEPTKYLIYSDGRVFSEFTNKFLKPFLNRRGYCLIDINHNGRCQTVQVHRLIAKAFIPNPNNLETVNHKNGIKTDNSVENLEWMSNLDNIRHAWKTGLAKPRYGEENPANVYSEEQIHDVCKFLEMGLLSNKMISDLTGVSVDTIVDVKYRNKWKQISGQYAFSKVSPMKFYRTKGLIKYLVDNGLTDQEIMSILYLSGKERAYLYKLRGRYKTASTTIPENGSTLTS